MTRVALFALLGLGSGALIAGLALALVLSYRARGVVNLAVGATAMVGGYAYWALHSGLVGIRLPPVLAAIAGVAVAGLVAAGTDALVFRPLRAAGPLATMAASLGVVLTAQAGVLLLFGTAPRPLPSLLPAGVVSIAEVVLPVDRLVLAAAVVVVVAALAAGYRWTRFGLATRALGENEAAAVLNGVPLDRLALANAAVGGTICGALGVFAGALVQLDSLTLPLQVVPALAAAVFARFASFGLAAVAGLLIGVLQSLVYYASTLDWFPTDRGNALPGVRELLVFGLIVVAMLWRGADLPRRGERETRRLPPVPQARHPIRLAVVGVAGCATALAVLPYDFRQALVISLIGAVIALSYVVIAGYVGQLSVMQVALSGVAGLVLSDLAVQRGVGFPVGPVVAIAVTTALGVLVGACTLRVRGVSLAVVTLAAALALEQFAFLNTTWGGGDGSAVPSPRLFGLDLGPTAALRGLDGGMPGPVFGWFVLGVTAALGLTVASLRRTGLGRRMLAVRANERAAAGAGIDVRRTKLIGFGISSAIAGVAGVLYGYNFGSVSASRYGALTAFAVIAFAYMGGITTVSGAALAGLMSTGGLFPHALQRWFGLSGTWALLVGGLGLIVTLVGNPDGLAGLRHRVPRGGPAAGP